MTKRELAKLIKISDAGIEARKKIRAHEEGLESKTMMKQIGKRFKTTHSVFNHSQQSYVTYRTPLRMTEDGAMIVLEFERNNYDEINIHESLASRMITDNECSEDEFKAGWDALGLEAVVGRFGKKLKVSR